MASLNRNTGFILGNVLGLALLVGGIIITAPQKQAEQAELDRKNSAPAVIAVSDIAAGTTLTAELLRDDRKPHNDMPLNAVEASKKIIGLVTKTEIKKDQVVTYSTLDLQSKELR